MRAALAALALGLGCGTPPKPGTAPPLPHVSVDAPPVSSRPVSNAVVKQVATRALIESPHAGAIKSLATTADATAALSCDDLDGYRLWPKLDGTVEPRVVDLPRARTLALAREGREFVAAVVDEVGGLVIAVMDADGRTTQRATIAPEPAFLGVVMGPLGPIAWRADHSIVQLDRAGTILSHLAVAAGQRLVTVVRAGDQAIALVETASGTTTTRRVQRLVLGPPMSWGDLIELGTDLGPIVALSPSGKRLASLVVDKPRNLQRTVVFEIASAKLIANHASRNATQLGFVDEDHLAIAQATMFEWLDLAAKSAVEPLGPSLEPFEPPLRRPLGVGPGVVVASRNDELELASPASTRYLGYGLEVPAIASVGPGGRTLIGLGETFAILDRDLREVGAPDAVVPKGAMVSDVRWVNGDDWLVATSNPNDGKTTIAIVDLTTRARTELRSNIPVAQLVRYEPSTRLVTLSLGEAPEVGRYDPDKRTLAKLLTLARPTGFEQRELAPVAPALANGTQLVSIQMRDRMTLRWVSQPTAIDRGPSVVVDGSLAGVDRAGHIYVWQNGADHKLALAVFDAGKQIGVVPTEGPTTLWPDPKGSQIALLNGRDVTLVGLDGTQRWTLPLQGATEALWLDEDALLITSGIGMVRVAVATGTIDAMRCGWRFGLTTAPHPFSNRNESLCVQRR